MIDSIWKAKFGSEPPAKRPAVPVKSETRQQKWKRLHPDKVRKSQMLLMRQKRAEAKKKKDHEG